MTVHTCKHNFFFPSHANYVHIVPIIFCTATKKTRIFFAYFALTTFIFILLYIPWQATLIHKKFLTVETGKPEE